MTGVLVKWGHLDTDTYSGECHMQMGGMIRVMILQTKECQRLPAAHQKLEGEAWNDSPSALGLPLPAS